MCFREPTCWYISRHLVCWFILKLFSVQDMQQRPVICCLRIQFGRVSRRIMHFTNSGNLEAQDQTKNAKGCVVWFLDFLGVYKQTYWCTFAITFLNQVGVSMIQLIRNYWPFNQRDHTSAESCSVGDLWWTPPQCIHMYIYDILVTWFKKL